MIQTIKIKMYIKESKPLIFAIDGNDYRLRLKITIKEKKYNKSEAAFYR